MRPGSGPPLHPRLGLWVLFLSVRAEAAPMRFLKTLVQQRNDCRRLGDAELIGEVVDALQDVCRNLEVDQPVFKRGGFMFDEILEFQLYQRHVGGSSSSLHTNSLPCFAFHRVSAGARPNRARIRLSPRAGRWQV